MTMRDALRERYDAGESLASLAADYSMACEDAFALICYARDLDRAAAHVPSCWTHEPLPQGTVTLTAYPAQRDDNDRGQVMRSKPRAHPSRQCPLHLTLASPRKSRCGQRCIWWAYCRIPVHK